MKRRVSSLVYVLLVSILLAGLPQRAIAYSGFAQAQASPSPSPSPVPVVATTPARALPELQARISAILAKPELSPAMVGIKVVSLDTGRVLFEDHADKLLRPAPNMKLYTVAAALDRLFPDYRFSASF